MRTCEGCGLEFKKVKGGLCKSCQKLKKAGAFDMPPLVEILFK